MLRSRTVRLLVALSLAGCTSREIPITAEPVAMGPQAAPNPGPAEPTAAEAVQGGGEVNVPRPANGVLPPGAADRVLGIGAQPIVKLIDAGAEPRADLSYTLAKGTSQKLGMAMDMTLTIKAKGQTIPQMPMPRMSMVFDTSAADKNPAGEFKIDSRLSSTSVDPNGAQQEQMARALRPQLDAMKGLGLVYWVNPKGYVRDVKLDLPQNMPAAAQQLMGGISQSFTSMVTPLPAEAVGAGARWQVVSRVATGGADILQLATYTLKARTGPRATLDVVLTQLAANDTIHTSAMPAGMSAKIKTFSSSGSGSTVLDLKSVAPEGGSMSLKTAMDISVQGGTQGDDSTVETTTSVQMTRP